MNKIKLPNRYNSNEGVYLVPLEDHWFYLEGDLGFIKFSSDKQGNMTSVDWSGGSPFYLGDIYQIDKETKFLVEEIKTEDKDDTYRILIKLSKVK